MYAPYMLYLAHPYALCLYELHMLYLAHLEPQQDVAFTVLQLATATQKVFSAECCSSQHGTDLVLSACYAHMFLTHSMLG
jgi:hypothetical protein